MAKVSTIYDVRVKFNLDKKAATKGLNTFNKKIKAVSKSLTNVNKKARTSSKNMAALGRSGGRAMRTIDRQARRASTALDRVSRKAKKAVKSTQGGGRGRSGSGGLGRLAGAAAGFFGGRELIKHTIGYNREIDNTKKSLATVIQLMDKDTNTRVQGLQKSSMLMKQLREDAKHSAGTFQDMTDFAKNIAPPVLAAGASMEQLRELTKGAVVAAAAFGIRADVAALDIRQALGKGLNKRDPFGTMLLDSVGMTTDAFNELDKASRMKTLQQAFNQPAIKAAAKEYQSSFEGVFSTFKSSLQEFGGKVGSKLFAKLAIELKKVNVWFTNNQQKVEMFATSMADGMVKAFNVAKEVFGFLFEHRELLMTLAKAMLIGKAGGVLAGPFLSFSKHLGGATTKLGGFANGLGKAIASFGVGFAIGTVFDDLTGASDKLSDAFDNLINGSNAFNKGVHVNSAGIDRSTPLGQAAMKERTAAAIRKKHAGRLEAAKMQDKLSMGGLMGIGGGNEERVKTKYAQDQRYAARLMEEARATRERVSQTKSIQSIIGSKAEAKVEAARMQVIAKGIMHLLDDRHLDSFNATDPAGMFSMMNPDGFFAKGPTKASEADSKDKKNNVKIGKIVMQIESNDPDRLALGMEGLFSDLAKNGAQASTALREG